MLVSTTENGVVDVRRVFCALTARVVVNKPAPNVTRTLADAEKDDRLMVGSGIKVTLTVAILARTVKRMTAKGLATPASPREHHPQPTPHADYLP